MLTLRLITRALALAPLLVCAVMAAPAPPASHVEPGDDAGYSLGSGARPVNLPFRFVANQVRLEATINGRGPLQLVLDTGMPIPGVLLFDSERVSKLELAKTGRKVAVAGAGGKGQPSQALMADGVDVAIGPLSVTKTRALVVERPKGFPPGLDGVIGGALFFHFVVRIDMDKQSLQLAEPSGWSPPANVVFVPLVHVQGMVFADLQVAVGPQAPVPARVVVDLGAGHALSLNNRAGGKFAPPGSAVEMPLGRGVSGVLHGRMGRVRRIELGGFAFENVVVAFPGEAHQRPGGRDFEEGNLGNELLKRFNVTFDYAGKRMLLEKSQRYEEPFDVPMAGVDLEWRPDSTLEVREVLPNSPAAVAGIVKGDILVAIDGVPTSTLGEEGLRKTLIGDGAERALTLKRGTQTTEKKLRLKRLV